MSRWLLPAMVGATAVGALLWVVFVLTLGEGISVDVRAYYLASYGGSDLGGESAYLYSPLFAQVTEPLRALGWDAFRTGWRLLEVAALVILTGPLSGPLLWVSPVATEVNAGNIHLLMSLAIVAGFRWPAAWAFVLLTKVTPGVGLLWFAVRREWRSLGIALGVTAALIGVSFVLNPGAWLEWVTLLARQSGDYADKNPVISAPLVVRLVAAALLVTWGARTDRRWTVIVAAYLALPVTWITGLSMLCGLVLLTMSARLGSFSIERYAHDRAAAVA